MAMELCQAPPRPPALRAPTFLLRLDYPHYRMIRYLPEKSLWHGEGLPFEARFFHLGHWFDKGVQVYTVEGAEAKEVPFSASLFDYGNNKFPYPLSQVKRLGFAGLQLFFPLNDPNRLDEVASFLGGTYFRMVGKGQRYGLSARGLAVDTAEEKGEEFPWFRKFWLVKPSPQERFMTIWALMDSERVTGAYAFVITPGDAATVQVTASLCLRKPVKKLGVAPLTSMFWFGENSRIHFNDYRPEVHDSDGLLVWFTTDEWFWRPLANDTKGLYISRFQDQKGGAPKGFGLLQRDRDYDHYLDPEANYHLRPSAWVEPRGDWGKGTVELVEIPTDKESTDNIVAYWLPQTLPPLKTMFSYEYVLSWFLRDGSKPPAGQAISTRLGAGDAPGVTKIVVDWRGGALSWLDDRSATEPDVTVSPQGKLIEAHAYKDQVTSGWRTVLQVASRLPRHPQPMDLRLFLKNGDQALGETWSMTLNPEKPSATK